MNAIFLRNSWSSWSVNRGAGALLMNAQSTGGLLQDETTIKETLSCSYWTRSTHDFLSSQIAASILLISFGHGWTSSSSAGTSHFSPGDSRVSRCDMSRGKEVRNASSSSTVNSVNISNRQCLYELWRHQLVRFFWILHQMARESHFHSKVLIRNHDIHTWFKQFCDVSFASKIGFATTLFDSCWNHTEGGMEPSQKIVLCGFLLQPCSQNLKITTWKFQANWLIHL